MTVYVLWDCNGMLLFWLARQDNTQLQQFLEARNPKKDGTLNLDALLAKPIVVRFSRVLYKVVAIPELRDITLTT